MATVGVKKLKSRGLCGLQVKLGLALRQVDLVGVVFTGCRIMVIDSTWNNTCLDVGWKYYTVT